MQKTPNKAFTLVELIVVITILAILGTIAFVSLQGYSKAARDSRRIGDIQNIKKTLELFSVKVGRYPDPTEAQPVTFSGGLAWYQGTFGDSTFTNVERMKKLPLDPLTELEYTYSLLNTNKEYEIAGMMETDKLSLSSPTYAAKTTADAFVQGTYNGIALRINLATTSYVLAVPTIITSIDLEVENNRELETIIPAKQMVLKNSQNLPSNYRNTNYNSEEEITNTDFEIVKDNDIDNLVVFEGNIDDLTASILVEKLQNAYSGTTVEGIQEIENFINLDTTDIDQSESVDNFGVNFINSNLGGAAITRIYNTCDSLPHNTTKSYYTGTGVTFTEGTCDGIKKDFTCKDGTWKDGNADADLATYQYTSCSVEGALNCTVLETELTHGDDLTVYSEDSIAWDAIYDCSEREGTITCNDGTPTGNTGFAYKTCAKGTPTNCDADSSYDENGHTYNVIQLDHNVSATPTVDISENNGTYTYTLDVICNNGTLSSTESGPVLDTCDTNYHTEDSSTCISDTRSCVITNGIGEQTWNGSSWNTCTVLTCNTGYYNLSNTCNAQWNGNATTGYLFKNTSGTEQYPTNCSNLLSETTWKNTLTGSPWNGTKFNDGVYWIKPDTNPAFKVYCDMTSDSGGWTLLFYVKDTNALGLYENGNICSDILENCRGDLKKLGASSSNTNGLNELMIKHTNGKQVQTEMNIDVPIYKSLTNGDIFTYELYNMYIVYDNIHNRGGNIDKLGWRYAYNSNNYHWLSNNLVDESNRYTYATRLDGNDIEEGIMKSVGYTSGNKVWSRYSHGFYVREKLTLTTWIGDGTEGNPWIKIGEVVSSCNDIRTSISTNPAGDTWSDVSGVGQDGVYQLGGIGIDVYCDMTTDGGGWRVVGKTFNYSYSSSTTCIDEVFFSASEITDIQTLLTEYSEVKIDSDVDIFIMADDSTNNSNIYTTKISDGTSLVIAIGNGYNNTQISLHADKNKIYCTGSDGSNTCGLTNKPSYQTSTEPLIVTRLFFQPTCNGSTASGNTRSRNRYNLIGTYYNILFK